MPDTTPCRAAHEAAKKLLHADLLAPNEEEFAEASRIIHDAGMGAAVEALRAVRKLWPGDEDANARFERHAAEFERDTGFLRPGKDASPADPVDSEERMAAWREWNDKRIAEVNAKIDDALRQLTGDTKETADA